MATNTLNTRVVICSKTTSQWANITTVPLKGEICIEWISEDSNTLPKMKVGNGTDVYADLPYATFTEKEIKAFISQAAFNLQPATASALGGVKIGSNVNVTSDGTISIPVASATSATAGTAGVMSVADKNKLNNIEAGADATDFIVQGTDDSDVYHITNGATVKLNNSSVTLNGTSAVFTIDSASTSKAGIVQLSSATNSTSTSQAATPSAVKSAYDKANAAMPKSGGTFTGAVTLNADPTADLGAATKQYVDTQITSKIAASDAMVFKGTLGTGGTVTAVPTTGVVKGDTYKVITAGTWAGSACKVGDLLIALNSGSVEANTTNWAYVPSGNENETTIKYSTTTQNLTTSAQTGAITVGEAATKQVDTSISAGSTSTKLPTSKAVATFVEGKGYITNSGTANKANTLTTPRTIAVGGSATSTATSFDGSQNITIPLTGVDTNILYQTAGNVLVIDGNFT